MYDYIKPAQGDFKPEIFVLHLGTNHFPLNKSPKEIFRRYSNSGGIDGNRK